MAEKIDIEVSKNEDHNKLAVSELTKKLNVIYKGGGEKRIAKQHEQGKLTARERIDALLDTKSARGSNMHMRITSVPLLFQA